MAEKEVSRSNAQRLGSVIKSARTTMRKDKGLSGELDRIPMLTWIMFLKFLDDFELASESEAQLAGSTYEPVIEPPYRWRDWAIQHDGATGPELNAFVNQDEAMRPDGTRGAGLFAYLRALKGTGERSRRDVISTVFDGVTNRMVSGYLLRDVVNIVDEIHFDSSDEIHTLSVLYESMLREMRDAAGDSGEFYTPRAVVRFMVDRIDPRLGEKVLDPAAGTGGFLVEAYEKLKDQCATVRDWELLQSDTLQGGEPKPLPYLLCQMNLLLHGVENPAIDPGNSLRYPLRELGVEQQVDVILTNPPFGGEEERSVLSNFPEDRRTTETAVLFMQLILRRLRKRGGDRPARCAVVVSDGFLSTKGVHGRVKADLLSSSNLHTIVRLPKGVFAPYTPIKTNLLFFEAGKATEQVWFYEVPPPVDRQMYTKTKPLPYEAFEDCLAWWDDRAPTQQAWSVSADTLAARGWDLDVENPARPVDAYSTEPAEIVRMASETIGGLVDAAEQIKRAFGEVPAGVSEVEPSSLEEVVTLERRWITVDDEAEYRLLTVKLHGRGIQPREVKLGREIKTKKQQVVRANDLVVAEIDAKVGGYGLVPQELDGAIVSGHYFVYSVDETRADLQFIDWYLRSGLPEIDIQPYVKGSTNYASVRAAHFPLLKLRLPPLQAQQEFARAVATLSGHVEAALTDLDVLRLELGSLVTAMLYRSLDASE